MQNQENVPPMSYGYPMPTPEQFQKMSYGQNFQAPWDMQQQIQMFQQYHQNFQGGYSDPFTYQNQYAHQPKIVTVTLQDPQDLWKELHYLSNEQNVLNNGRKIFPALNYKVEHLNPESNYKVEILLRRMVPYQIQYSNGSWSRKNVQSKKTIAMKTEKVFVGEFTGQDIMRTGLDLSDVKVFNIGSDNKKKVTPYEEMSDAEKREYDTQYSKKKTSMLEVSNECKYIPVLIINEILPNQELRLVGEFENEITQFATVSSYKNHIVKALRTAANPTSRGDAKQEAVQVGKQWRSSNKSLLESLRPSMICTSVSTTAPSTNFHAPLQYPGTSSPSSNFAPMTPSTSFDSAYSSFNVTSSTPEQMCYNPIPSMSTDYSFCSFDSATSSPPLQPTATSPEASQNQIKLEMNQYM